MKAIMWCFGPNKIIGELQEQREVEGVMYYTFLEKATGRCYTLQEPDFTFM